jgi:hypothetical protein
MVPVVLVAPLVMRVQRTADLTIGISHIRQIGIALTEFETEYGSFANEETAAQIKAKNPTDLHLAAKTSNDVCGQLIVSGIVASEQMFYAKVKGAQKPDSIITAGEVVEKGECGFSFLSELSSGGNRSRPLVVTFRGSPSSSEWITASHLYQSTKMVMC